jgi:hypothetical protein
VRATQIVRRLCEPCLEHVHASRFRAVLRAVEGLVCAQRVSLTAIGRALRGKLQPRHGIKAMDRLLGNPKFRTELRDWYAALARKLVGSEERIAVLLDWTQLHGEFWALVAAVPFTGRSIPVYCEVHKESKVGSRQVEAAFLRQLRSIIPAHCRPIIVADGGFRSPFFRACREACVDYVIRLRNDRAMARVSRSHSLRPCGWNGIRFDVIFAWARRAKARCLGMGVPYLTSEEAEMCRLVLGPKPKKDRRRAKYADDYERKRACEPFLLATTLENHPAESVVAIYTTRMQVEECFRDTKNGRFGWGLEFAASRSTDRLNVLLLLVSIAFATITLLGATAHGEGLEKRFRASSRSERVLSFFSLGNLVARSTLLRRQHLRIVWKHLETIRTVSRLLFEWTKPRAIADRKSRWPVHHDRFCADCGWDSYVL